nr:immunoglobulin light chain junction region [Macaca mulatta]MOW39410.1 immunoglobulin light chain junction region [Macaca mulatta]MOW39697.1 immunoglobulin light chain junction region [Macaca mulatta]MOW39976.1 immunoglobulin light chain junction region [Macaca mulatta]MOW40174.1 immunoglobulin light chain junction region [Macaca mulatta]
CQQHNSFPWTF